MAAPVALFALPLDLELWIVLGYGSALIAAAWIIEALARLHFERARRHGEQGFEYIHDANHYRCAGGERLLLHQVDESSKLATYRAPASRCNSCPMKPGCTSRDDGRMVFRSLASWAESDVGWFHQRMSAAMVAIGVVLCSVELGRRAGEPGADFLLLGLLLCLALFVRSLARMNQFRGWGPRVPETGKSPR